MSAGPALEMWSRQNSAAESRDGRTFRVEFQRAFTVTLAAGDRVEEAYNANGLPLVGSLYPGTGFVFCTRLQAERVSPIMAMVTASYDGEVGPDGDLGGSPIPANEVKISWRNVTTDELIDEDWNGKAIVTANDEPIEGITEKVCDQMATIERAYLAINMYAIRGYLRAVNSDEFLGWPAGTARIMDYQANAVFIAGRTRFWNVTAAIQFREPFRTTAAKAWYKRVRHEGFLVRNAAGDPPLLAVDRGGKSPVTRPVLLKADGTRETDPENAHWLEFQTLGSLPFSVLGLTV